MFLHPFRPVQASNHLRFPMNRQTDRSMANQPTGDLQTLAPSARHPQYPRPVRHCSRRANQDPFQAANPLPQNLYRRRPDSFSGQSPCWHRRIPSDHLACQSPPHCCQQRRDRSVVRCHPTFHLYLAVRYPHPSVVVPAQPSPGIVPAVFAMPRRRKPACCFLYCRYRPHGCQATSPSPFLMTQTGRGRPLPLYRTSTEQRDRFRWNRLYRRGCRLLRHQSSHCSSRHRTSLHQQSRLLCPLRIRIPWRPGRSFQTDQQAVPLVPSRGVVDPASLCPAADVHQFLSARPAA